MDRARAAALVLDTAIMEPALALLAGLVAPSGGPAAPAPGVLGEDDPGLVVRLPFECEVELE